MSTSNNTVQITSLPDLAQILPCLLGHYPDDSIALHAPGPNFLDGPTMTCPLPEDIDVWQATAEHAARQFVAHQPCLHRSLDIYPGYTMAKLLLDGSRMQCDPARLLTTYRDAAAEFAASGPDLNTR